MNTGMLGILDIFVAPAVVIAALIAGVMRINSLLKKTKVLITQEEMKKELDELSKKQDEKFSFFSDLQKERLIGINIQLEDIKDQFGSIKTLINTLISR